MKLVIACTNGHRIASVEVVGTDRAKVEELAEFVDGKCEKLVERFDSRGKIVACCKAQIKASVEDEFIKGN